MAPALEAQGTPKKVRVVGVPIDEKAKVVSLPTAKSREFAEVVPQTEGSLLPRADLEYPFSTALP